MQSLDESTGEKLSLVNGVMIPMWKRNKEPDRNYDVQVPACSELR